MKRAFRFRASAAGILLPALLYFFDDMGLTAALLPAVMIHELGHAAALTLCGAAVTGLELGAFGLRMDYTGALDSREEALCAGAGPAAGLLWTLAACACEGDYLRLSGTVSFCLSAVNLLPALPLDGGRILLALAGERAARRVSGVLAGLLVLGGIALLPVIRSPVLLASGIWIWLSGCKTKAL